MRQVIRTLIGGTLSFAGFMWLATTAVAQQTAWKPEKNIEVIVPSGAGGGLDQTARALQGTWHEKRILTAPAVIVNKPGGSGNISYNYLSTFKGDAHYVSISSPTLLTNHIVGTGRFSHADFTPLANLTSEYLIVSVGANSPMKSGKDVLDRLKKDPAGLSIAIGSVIGGSNHIGIATVLKNAGVDIRKLRTVVFKSSGESVVAVMGGHVDIAVGAPALALKQAQGGTLRAIAIAAPRRLSGAFSSVPTWKELGVDVTADTWRGLVAPKGLTDAQTAWWDRTLAQSAATEEWKTAVDRAAAEPRYLNSGQTRKFLDEEYRELKSILLDLGLVK